LAGCSALPDKPTRPVAYDFGSGFVAPTADGAPNALPPIALGDVDTAGVADTAAVSYRLQYTDAQQLRPYALARWTLPPAQLVRQRIREVLGHKRPVMDVDDVLAQSRIDGSPPRILRLQLEEFSQVFSSPEQSEGVLRIRATVVDNLPQGDRFIGQRVFALRRAAPTPDAPGGVRALTLATDAAAAEIEAWLAGLPLPVTASPYRAVKP
jgi:cholesterol transport system auxiliary component